MAELTEVEIRDRLRQSIRAAIDLADKLAVEPKQGPNFAAFRRELKLVEGCCRQMAAWREDSRWLPLGLMMEEAHQRALRWIVGHAGRGMFRKLADNLRGLERALVMLETQKTGRLGMILPEPGRTERVNRAVQVPAGMVARPSGLVVPR